MRKFFAIAIPVVFFVSVPTNADAFFFLAALPFAGSFAAATGIGVGAAAATTATAGIGLGTIAQIGLGVLGAAGTIFQGMAAKEQAEAEAAQADLNAKLEDTQGLQRDTQRREQLERTVGSIRANRGGQGLYSPTSEGFLQEANENINSDRIVEMLNSRQRSSDLRASAAQSRRRGRTSLFSGIAKGGTSLFKTGAYLFS